jgi:hypothetical protein
MGACLTSVTPATYRGWISGARGGENTMRRSATATVLLTVALTSLATTPAHATFPGRNGRITFMRQNQAGL